jgi:hypothetical protein
MWLQGQNQETSIIADCRLSLVAFKVEQSMALEDYEQVFLFCSRLATVG